MYPCWLNNELRLPLKDMEQAHQRYVTNERKADDYNFLIYLLETEFKGNHKSEVFWNHISTTRGQTRIQGKTYYNNLQLNSSVSYMVDVFAKYFQSV